MIDYSDHGVVWYAMKTTYKKELQAKVYLESRGVECFIPMKQETIIKRGRKDVVLRPAVHNLIFVKTDLAQLKDIKISLSYLHNCLTTCGEVSRPIIVPTQQMDQFIDVVTHHLSKIIYADLSTTRIERGTPVRIIGGDFAGYVGELEKIKGKRDRRVSVNIEGVVVYKIDVDVCYIEKI